MQGRGLRVQAPIGGIGRLGGSVAGGPGGECYCPNCGYVSLHVLTSPCYEYKCPNCGNVLTRR